MALEDRIVSTKVKIEGFEREFFHRGTESDAGVIAQTFLHQQYLLPNRHESLIKRYKKIISEGKIPLIIDAGANIGTSTKWFCETFPGVHIVSIEPDEQNFRLLVRNCAEHWVDFRKGAISNTAGFGALLDPGRGPLGFMTGEGSGMIFWSADQLISEKTALGMTPFVFKCDIEGGEDRLFASNTDWVDEFYLVVVETHDWMLPGSGSSRNLLKAISSYHRDFMFYGENIFSIKNIPLEVECS